jgi:hypothetical protein
LKSPIHCFLVFLIIYHFNQKYNIKIKFKPLRMHRLNVYHYIYHL